MKTKLLAFILALSFIEAYAQYTMIPDANFEQALINLEIDSNMTPDGQVLTTEISSVTSLDITNLGISNLAGIEGFTALETLICRFNNLTSVNLASNTSLTYLDLFENSLTTINV
ncbi:MAG TPA: hypothetical protein VKN14_14320 [Flavobacteriaceae bacterium]|nr:hypothetical protein [Flavobacteriaceae bacterium]